MGRDPSKYEVDGQRVPSVTEIFDICGVTDLSGIPAEALEKAAKRGTRVHDWTEKYDLHARMLFHAENRIEFPKIPKDIKSYCEAYLSFLSETGFEVHDIELTVINKDYKYAGQLDRTGIFPGGTGLRIPVPGGMTVLDLKCVHQVKPETALQTAGYYLAAGMEKGNRCSLNLKPDGTWNIQFYYDDQDFHDFLSLVNVAHWKIRNGVAELPKRGQP